VFPELQWGAKPKDVVLLPHDSQKKMGTGNTGHTCSPSITVKAVENAHSFTSLKVTCGFPLPNGFVLSTCI
jgi:hypothetical protein